MKASVRSNKRTRYCSKCTRLISLPSINTLGISMQLLSSNTVTRSCLRTTHLSCSTAPGDCPLSPVSHSHVYLSRHHPLSWEFCLNLQTGWTWCQQCKRWKELVNVQISVGYEAHAPRCSTTFLFSSATFLFSNAVPIHLQGVNTIQQCSYM